MEDKLDQLFEKYPPHLTHFKWREGDGEQPEGVFDITELSQAIQSLINSAVREARKEGFDEGRRSEICLMLDNRFAIKDDLDAYVTKRKQQTTQEKTN